MIYISIALVVAGFATITLSIRRLSVPFFAIGFVWLVCGLALSAVAAGQADEARVQAACERHGMDGYRISFGRSLCIDKDGNLRAFKDVR